MNFNSGSVAENRIRTWPIYYLINPFFVMVSKVVVIALMMYAWLLQLRYVVTFM